MLFLEKSLLQKVYIHVHPIVSHEAINLQYIFVQKKININIAQFPILLDHEDFLNPSSLVGLMDITLKGTVSRDRLGPF